MVNFAAVYCHNNKRKNKDKTFFHSPKDTSVARVWIAKLNKEKEKDNLPSKVYVCNHHFEDDCFDSPWMLQSTLTYSGRPIQRRFCPGAIPTKFPHKPVKDNARQFLNNAKRLIAKKRFVFLIHQKLLTRRSA